MTCKILDKGTTAEHFGGSLGGGVFIVRDAEAGTVSICRHPGGDVRALPDVDITATEDAFETAVNEADREVQDDRPPAEPAPE